MSDKLDRKEEAAGFQYIRKFLVPMAAKEYGEDWEPIAKKILVDLRRTADDCPILGKDMTHLLFYRALIERYPGSKRPFEFIFRIGKYLGRVVVSYYTEFSQSKWYYIDETPDKSMVLRMTESHGWEGPDQNHPEITKMEEQEALQFIRNVAIPYTIDHIYNVFKAFNPRAPVEDFPPLTADDLRNKLKKWQHNLPNSIVYLVEFGKDPRSYFKYYIQKVSGAFGIRVMIHNQLPMVHSQKTNDVVLYIGKGRQPSWFQKLGYIKEAHNPQSGDDINREEEQDATRTFIEHVLPDAVHWFNRRDSFAFASDPHITTTPEEVKRNMKKVERERDFILYKFEKEGRLLWFGISKKAYDNHILSIGYHIGEIRQEPTWYGEKGYEYKDDYKTGWHWRQYQPDKKEWDVFIETMMPPGENSDVSKKEELQAVQWIRDYLFKYVAHHIGSTEQHLRSTFRKTKHANDIFYHSKSGLPNYEDVDFIIYKDEGNKLIIGVENGPGWYMSFPVGHREYMADFDRINENATPMPPSDPRYDLSRMEEARALQFIRGMIPKVTDELNLYIASGASGIKFHHNLLVFEESIAKNLKKTEHRKQVFSSRRGPQDYIEYTSAEIGRPPVIFYVYKTERQRGDPESGVKIAVGYKNFNPRLQGSGTTTYINENDGGKYPGETDDAYVNRMVKISPREEAEALTYIKKYLFEKASSFWNGMMAAGAKHEYYVSPETISQNFKKVSVKRIPPEKYLERHAHETIYYESVIPHVKNVSYRPKQKGKYFKNGLTFKFHTTKDADGRVYVGFVPPGRNDHGLNYGLDKLRNPPHLEESVNKEMKRVSRKEEAEALQYIRRVLGPIAIESWNQRTSMHQLTSDDVFKHMRKIVDARPPDLFGDEDVNTIMTTDYIKYSTIIPVRDMTLDHKIYFTFAIYKNKENQLVVDFKTNLVDGGPFLVGYNAGSPAQWKQWIRESVEDDPNPNPHKAISKIDELRAVDYIKKLVIPVALNRWNRIYKPHGVLSIERALKTLRKKTHEAWPRIISDFVTYEAETTIPGKNLYFEIWKDGVGRLMVGWKITGEENLWGTYLVNSQPIDESMSSSERAIAKELQTKHSISKMDEAQAADFIKKKLIPNLVDFVNDTSRHYTRQRQISVEEVLKTFRKIGAWDSKYGYRREVQYQALFLGEPFLFDIFKDNGKLMVLQKSDGTSHRVT